MIVLTSPLGDTLRQQLEDLIANWRTESARDIKADGAYGDVAYAKGVADCADEVAALVRAVPLGAALPDELRDALPGTPIGPSNILSRAVERLYTELPTEARWRLRTEGFSLDPILLALRPPAPVEPTARAGVQEQRKP